jgi:hypothetical protein
LSSFGATLGLSARTCVSLRKYSLLDVEVRRVSQYPDPLSSFVPLLVTSETCGPLDRPASAP